MKTMMIGVAYGEAYYQNRQWSDLEWKMRIGMIYCERVRIGMTYSEREWELVWPTVKESENWCDLQWKRVRTGMTYSERENWYDLQRKRVRTGMTYNKRKWKQWHGSEPFTKDNSWKTTTKSQDIGAVPFSGVEAATPPLVRRIF